MKMGISVYEIHQGFCCTSIDPGKFNEDTQWGACLTISSVD